MSLEERPEPDDGNDTADTPLPAERDLVDDLSVQIAELDAIAWNLPRGSDDGGPASDASDRGGRA